MSGLRLPMVLIVADDYAAACQPGGDCFDRLDVIGQIVYCEVHGPIPWVHPAPPRKRTYAEVLLDAGIPPLAVADMVAEERAQQARDRLHVVADHPEDHARKLL
jgi:hypothetical protein